MIKIPVLNEKKFYDFVFCKLCHRKTSSSFIFLLFIVKIVFLIRKQLVHGLGTWDEILPPSFRLVLSLSMGVGVPGCQPSACHTLSLLDGSVRSKMKMKRMRRWRRVAGTSCRRFSIA